MIAPDSVRGSDANSAPEILLFKLYTARLDTQAFPTLSRRREPEAGS